MKAVVFHRKNSGMWNLKHDISSPKFYELLLKIYLKGDTDIDLKNFYNCIKMSLNAVMKLREYLLPLYQEIPTHTYLCEHFIPNHVHLSYTWNE